MLVWDRLNTHVSHAMRELVAQRAWLMVVLLPVYSPDLNPVEWVWAHVKRSLPTLPWSPSTDSRYSYTTGSNACSTGSTPWTAS
ncbi:transposase [Kitasatospora sp. NBC_00374]|uniref:transposase n=1 Tax=Kitasatospora sp. NBC_00374 TaxID=2975964 RepID=UPI0030E311E1